MNGKVKFLWIYTAILFSFALILIIFAYLTQNNISKENEAINKNMSGYKANIESLTKENENLKQKLDELNTELADEKAKNEKYYEIEKNDNTEEIATVNETVKKAFDEFAKGNKKNAKNTVKDIDTAKTGDLQKYIIDKINE
ncbi:hypothetical protein [Qingrenia yutianensis]|uniref:Uncharacterized protein n=1 Tax=Qingrenia yutianensis TaxID=2763676 RepID=A0A926IUT0_9FIRM|nr:hypothetical protein [Qingrenia yutianensis]MBC8597178.1 hypothetical protein [Qingrenia yutianensis]